MHPLQFKELFFPCVTGSIDLSSKPALKIFILSNIKLTCWDLHQKVDALCKEAFLNICPGAGNVSIQFICRWILGKPSINELTHYPIRDFSLVLMAEKMKSQELIPIRNYYLWYKAPEFTLIKMTEEQQRTPSPHF